MGIGSVERKGKGGREGWKKEGDITCKQIPCSLSFACPVYLYATEGAGHTWQAFSHINKDKQDHSSGETSYLADFNLQQVSIKVNIFIAITSEKAVVNHSKSYKRKLPIRKTDKL